MDYSIQSNILESRWFCEENERNYEYSFKQKSRIKLGLETLFEQVFSRTQLFQKYRSSRWGYALISIVYVIKK